METLCIRQKAYTKQKMIRYNRGDLRFNLSFWDPNKDKFWIVITDFDCAHISSFNLPIHTLFKLYNYYTPG